MPIFEQRKPRNQNYNLEGGARGIRTEDGLQWEETEAHRNAAALTPSHRPTGARPGAAGTGGRNWVGKISNVPPGGLVEASDAA